MIDWGYLANYMLLGAGIENASVQLLMRSREQCGIRLPRWESSVVKDIDAVVIECFLA